MINLNNYRIIDLSSEILPGESKIDGRYLHGEENQTGRPVEVTEFIAYAARMHHMKGQTHCGTHVEGTYKYDEQGADMADMPLENYIGEAIIGDFSHKSVGQEITADELEEAGVKGGDIVLLRGKVGPSDQRPHLSMPAVQWLIDIKIKLLGMEFIKMSPPDTTLGTEDTDGRMLLAGIPMADTLKGLHQIRKSRVFFIALPLRIHRITASWTRAIALEEIG